MRRRALSARGDAALAQCRRAYVPGERWDLRGLGVVPHGWALIEQPAQLLRGRTTHVLQCMRGIISLIAGQWT